MDTAYNGSFNGVSLYLETFASSKTKRILLSAFTVEEFTSKYLTIKKDYATKSLVLQKCNLTDDFVVIKFMLSLFPELENLEFDNYGLDGYNQKE